MRDKKVWKKILAVILSVVCCLSIINLAPIAQTAKADGTVTIYYHIPNASQVYLNAWIGASTGYPGASMTQVGSSNWWVIEQSCSGDYLMGYTHDGLRGVDQTQNYYVSQGTYYLLYNGAGNVLYTDRSQAESVAGEAIPSSNIAVTLVDGTDSHWLSGANDGVTAYFTANGVNMTQVDGTHWTATINAADTVTFGRGPSYGDQGWNSWTASGRGSSTTYTATGNGTGTWETYILETQEPTQAQTQPATVENNTSGITIYFYGQGWTAANLWSWNGYSTTTWPGDALTKVNGDWWKITLNVSQLTGYIQETGGGRGCDKNFGTISGYGTYFVVYKNYAETLYTDREQAESVAGEAIPLGNITVTDIDNDIESGDSGEANPLGNITVTLMDGTSSHWLSGANDGVTAYFTANGVNMTQVDETLWTADIAPSDTVTFGRGPSYVDQSWNSWNATGRDSETTYIAIGDGTGQWGTVIPNTEEDNTTNIYCYVKDEVLFENDYSYWGIWAWDTVDENPITYINGTWIKSNLAYENGRYIGSKDSYGWYYYKLPSGHMFNLEGMNNSITADYITDRDNYYFGYSQEIGCWIEGNSKEEIFWLLYPDSELNLHTTNVGSHTVELSWSPLPNINIAGYRIYRNQELVGETNDCSFNDFALDPDEFYTYAVIGYTEDDIETVPVFIDVKTNAKPKVNKVYTDSGNIVGGDRNILYAKVTDNNLSGAVGRFYIVSDNGKQQIGSDLTTYQSVDSEAVYQLAWDLKNVKDGSYNVVFQLIDSDGEYDEFSMTIIVDNTIPSTIVGLLAQGDIRFIDLSWAIAAEYGITTYRIYRRVAGESDWNLLKELSGSRNNTYYTDKNVEFDIEYEYSVTAVATNGMESFYCDAAKCSLISDTEKPVVNSLSPAKNSVLNGEITVSASAVDNDRVACIHLYYKRSEDAEAVLIASADNANVSARLNTVDMVDGKIIFYAVATDASGNIRSGQPVYTCKIDNTGPRAVTDLSYTSTSTVITLAWKYQQDDDFHHFVVEEKQDDGSFKSVATSNKTLGVNITGLRPSSAHVYRVYTVDQVGNRGDLSVEMVAETKADSSAPVVSLISPSAGYKNDDFTMTFTLKDDYAVSNAVVQVSRDRINWDTVDVKRWTSPSSIQTLKYLVRVSDYSDDGSIYFRAIPTDYAGNIGDSSNASAPFVEYILDRIAPTVPTNVTAQANGTGIYIRWDNDSLGETAGYTVLRATRKDGIYQTLASNIKSISYYDRTASAETVYWYQIKASDSIGNVSDASESISAKWTNTSDTEAPQILSISPVEGTKLGGNNTIVSVLAQDDRILSRVDVIYGKEALPGVITDKQTLTMNGVESYYIYSGVTLDLTSYETGDEMKVTVVAYDGNGNASDEVSIIYNIDKTAPDVTNLSVSRRENSISITWDSGANSDDLNGYYIYRFNGNSWTKIGTRAARDGGHYSFEDILSSSGTYTYKVVAIDIIGNQAEYFSENISYTKPVTPKLIADFDIETQQQQQNVQYGFDASESYSSDGDIVSYHFDFGDGTFAVEKKPTHTYTETGTYTVKLTVTNENGITASSSKIVEVKERMSIGKLEVTVVDDSGVPVANAPVYFGIGTDKQVIRSTDGKGMVSFTSAAGTYTVGTYMDDYLPVTKQAIVSGGTTKSIQLIMVNQPIVTGEFEVKRMTLEEIREAKIDPTNPANQNCARVLLQLTYGEQKIDVNYVYNGNGTVVNGSNTVRVGDRTLIVIPVDNSIFYDGDILNGNNSGVADSGVATRSKVVAVMDIPVSASCLKEFFDVKLHIINQATEDFTLEDNVVSLNVPDGMTLITTEGRNSAVEHRDVLNGQETWTLSWILRGDEVGDYDLTADYSSVLKQFDIPVSATFKTQEPIKVYGMNALKLIAIINDNITYGGFYFDLALQNVGGTDIYLPQIDVFDNFIYNYEVNTTDLSDTDDSNSKVTIRNTSLTNQNGYKQYFGKNGSVDRLAVGETFTKEYVVYNSIVSTDRTFLHDAILKSASDLGIQVEIKEVRKDLYSASNAEDKFESISTTMSKLSAYYNILNDDNYYYYQQALTDEKFLTYLGQTFYDVSNAVIRLNWNAITHDKERDIARQYIYELLEDESFQHAVALEIDKTNLELTQKIIADVKGMLASDTSKYMSDAFTMDDINAVLGETNNIRKLATALQDGGVESFSDRLRVMLGSVIGATGAKVIQEGLEQDGFLINSYNYGTIGLLNAMSSETKKALGDVSDALGTVDEVITAWNTASKLNQQLIGINAAQEQALALCDDILACEWIEKTSTYEEVQKIRDGLKNGFKTQQELFIDEIQKSVLQGDLTSKVINDVVIGSIDKIFFAGATYGVGSVLTTLRAVYSIADYVFGWQDTANIYTSIKVAGYISLALDEAVREKRTDKDYFGFLVSLKYLIKMRIVGERSFVNLALKYKGLDGDYKPENVLKEINKDRGTNYGSLSEYYQAFREEMLTYRDLLFDEVEVIEDRPAAPQVTFDYINGRTAEKFSSQYEYSLNGVDWTTCGKLQMDDYIYVSGKSIGQTLYVRYRGSTENVAGYSAVVALTATPKHRYATKAGSLKSTSVIWGVTPNTVYEVLKADVTEPINLDWSKAVLATADDDGIMSLQISGSGDYLYYRMPANASSFAAETHSIIISRDLLVEVTVDVIGTGIVTSENENFQSKILINGDEITLNAVYDKETVDFDGWFLNGEIYDERDTLGLEVNESIALTAHFNVRPQYKFNLSASVGGRVEGTGIYYQGKIATACAFADKGYTFSHWEDENGEAIGINSTRSVTMTEDTTLKAIFEALPTAHVLVSLNIQENDGMKKPTAMVWVDGKSFNVTVDAPFDENIGEIMQGEIVTVTANSTVDATFVRWQTETGIILSEETTYSFKATEYNHVVASYRVAGQTVTFVDRKGNILSNRQYLKNADAESIAVPTAPQANGYVFVGWKMSGTDTIYYDENELKTAIYNSISDGFDVVLNAVYENLPEQYTITVINGSGSGTYDASTSITLTANKAQAGKFFVGWYEDDILISSRTSFCIYVTSNRIIEARFSDLPVEAVGTTYIESVSANSSTKKISFVSVSSVPNNCTIERAGIVATADCTIGEDEDNFNASTAMYIRYGTTTSKNYQYTWTKGSVSTSQTWYVRAYLVYTDENGNVHTVYGDIIAATLNGVIG